MKKVSLLVVVICMMACKPEIKTLPLNEFEASVQQSNAVLLDVRTWDEYASGHIANAINVDWKSDNFEQEFAKLDIPKEQTIAVYCLHAKRSQAASECIIDMGYKNVIQLEGGIEPWTGLELVTEFSKNDLVGQWQVCKVDSIDGLVADKIGLMVGKEIPPDKQLQELKAKFESDYNRRSGIKKTSSSSSSSGPTFHPRVSFKEDGTISATIGCNIIDGEYTFKRYKLNIKLGMQTEVYCGSRVAMYESAWFSFLGGSAEIRPFTKDSILFKRSNRFIVLRKME